MVGGVYFFLDLVNVDALIDPGIAIWKMVASIITAICLIGGPLGLLAIGAAGPGWKRTLGTIGAMITLLGLVSYIVGFVYIAFYPDMAFRQRFTPGGSALQALGMTLFGIAVLATRRLRGWRGIVPLLVGLFFPLQLPLQIGVFLNGKGAPGPSGALLGGWGLLWLLLGYVIWSSAQGLRAQSLWGDIQAKKVVQ
jgi:hypothetical protein